MAGQNSPIPDAELILMVRRGRTDEFGKIIERYWARVRSLVRRTVRCPEQVEDFCQETFYKAFHCLDQFDVTRNFGPWVYKIAANLIGEHYRKHGKWVQLISLEQDMQIESLQGTEDTAIGRNMIDHYLENLPWPLRLILIMKHGLMLNYEEIAEVLDEPVGTVKGNLFRARVILKGLRERGEDFRKRDQEVTPT